MKPTPFFRQGLAIKVSARQPTLIILPPGRIQKRLLLTGVLLFHVFFSSFSQEKDFLLTVYDSCHVRAPQGTIAPLAVAGAPLVRIAYIIPSNRTPQPNATAYLQHAIKTGQQWYREQMEQNGFEAKTFLFETAADGITPLVHITNVTETDDYLRGDIWGRTLQAAINAGLSVWAPGEVWVIMPETHVMAPDGTITGGVALGASNGTGNSPGVCMIGSNALPLFKPEMITDDTPYDGKTLAVLGPYPLKQDLSFAWFEGTTFSSVTSSYIGALLHEMGHAFGLAHDFRNDNNFHGNLMGNGLRGMRGSLFPQRYPQDVTRLEYAAGLILSVSHYFNRDKLVTSSPVLNYNNPGPLVPQQGLVRLPFEASDADSLSLAQLRYDGNLVAEMVLKGTRMTATFAVPYYTKGAANSYTIALHDKQGNATYTGVQFAVPAGYNQAPIPFIRINPAIPGNSPFITLDASQSQDVDHSFTLVTAAWDVNNDGQFDIESGTGKMAQYGYASPGNYLIRVKLKDPDGAETISTPVSVKITTPGTPPGGNGTGLRAEYFNNVSLTGAPVVSRVDQQVDFTWNAASPASGVNADNFSARWTGQVEAPVTGNYIFSTVSDDGVRLWVNGVLVIDNWTDHGPTVNSSVGVALAAGTRYDIRMEFYERTVGAVARLLWAYPGQTQQPVPQGRLYPAGAGGNGTGLRAEYFNNVSLTGTPVVSRVDQQVDFVWNTGSPAPEINADNFSVRWIGQVEAPVTGNYIFSTVSDDGVRLWVNGVQMINNWTDHAPTVNNSAAIPLKAGTKYDISMEFYDHTLGALARLLWVYPGQAQQPVPQTRLYPEGGVCYSCQCSQTSLALSSQAEVDAFKCTEFTGILIISGSDITNLRALSSLKSVGSISILNNPRLANLQGLNALELVTGAGATGVSIYGNAILTDIDALTSLRAIGRSAFIAIDITNNPMLKNINGLISIRTLNAGLSITGNASLENVDGLRNLIEVKQDESLNAGFLTIKDNASLKNIDGLSSLKRLYAGRNGGLFIQNNPLLTNIDGLSSLTAIDAQIAGGLFIENNAKLNNVNGLRSVKSITWGPAGRISIQNNASLENLDGLSSITTLGIIPAFTMAVVNNPVLTRCCGLFPILGLISPDIRNSLVTMSGNGSACTIEDIMAGGRCIPIDCNDIVVALRSQRDVDAFPCTSVARHLLISGPDITNLLSLSSLTSVGSIAIIDNPRLPGLDGLEGLRSVSPDPALRVTGVTISGNAILTNIDALASLRGISSNAYEAFNISNNPMLKNINGLISITGLNAGISITDNASLENVDGLKNVAEIKSILALPRPFLNSGYVTIRNNASLKNIDGLSSLKILLAGTSGGVFIQSNPLLTNIEGLSSLTTIDARMTATLAIEHNDRLKNLDGLRSLTGITWGEAGGISIQNNPVLENADGLSSIKLLGNLSAGTFRIDVLDNRMLTRCCGLFPMVSSFSSGVVHDLVNISGNGSGCTIEDIIAGGKCSGNNGTGLRAQYFNNISLTGAPAVSRVDQQVNFTWNASPAAGINADNFSVRWTGQVEAPVTGNFVFSTVSDDGVRLWINGIQVINNWTDHGPTVNSSAVIPLTTGMKYDIRMEFYEHTVSAVARLLWAYPGQVQQLIPQSRLYPAGNAASGTGLSAQYFNNLSLTGAPAVSRVDPQVNFTWNTASPAAGVNADHFSVRWTGQVEAPVTGNFVFSTVSDDGVRLWINGMQVISNWTDHGTTINSSSAIPLVAGTRYEIRMEYYEHTAAAVARLLWSYPGQAQQPVPQSRLYPPGSFPGARIASEGLPQSAAVASSLKNGSLLVYPNPVNNILHIAIYSDMNGQAEISMQSSFSQERVKISADLLAGENRFEIPVHDLRNGLYVLTVNQAGQEIKRRIVIAK